MNDSARSAYVPRPQSRAKTAPSWGVPAAGSGALAAGLFWVLAPGFNSPEAAPAPRAPEAPLAAPVKAEPATLQLRSAEPAAVQSVAAGVERAPAPKARPAWAVENAVQRWAWPRKLELQGDGLTIERRLAAWYPANPQGRQFQYLMTVDRRDAYVFEEEVPDFIRGVLREEEERRAREEAERAAERERQAKLAAKRAEFDRQDTERIAAQKAALERNAPSGGGGARPVARAGSATTFGPRGARGGFSGMLAGTAAGAAEPEQSSEEVSRIRKEVRRQMLAAAVALSKGQIVSARDITGADGEGMAELTMADGTKKIVPLDPLVFDLRGTGVRTTTRKTLFDLYGHGRDDRAQWMNDFEDGVGILVFDPKGAGAGKDGSGLFGDRTDLDGVGRPTGFPDGFAALRGLVEKAVSRGVLKRETLDDGILDAHALAALEKAYGLRMKVGGLNKPAIPLAQAGVKSIALSRAPVSRVTDFDGNQNDLMLQNGAVFQRTDGTTGTYMNVWLSAKQGNLGLKTLKHL